MKKLMMAALAVFAFGEMSAQDLTFGVKGGVNFSNLTGEGVEADGTTGFYVGGLADISLTDEFHFQPEVLYSMEGAKDASLTYLRIPLMAKYYIADSFALLAGPSLGFKVGAEDDFIDEATKSMDFGLGIGAAYELENGFFFDARYNLGLSNISDVEEGDLKNTNFQVGVGFRF